MLQRASGAHPLVAANDDPLSRRHYLAAASHLHGEHAYNAAWQFLVWNGLMSMDGWSQWLANYGEAKAWTKPLHMVVWGVFILVPLLLGLKGMIIGTEVQPVERPSSRKSGDGDAGGSESRKRPAPEPSVKRPTTKRSKEAPKPHANHDETLKPNTELRPPNRNAALEPQTDRAATGD